MLIFSVLFYLRDRDNLSTRDKTISPKVSLVRRFHSTVLWQSARAKMLHLRAIHTSCLLLIRLTCSLRCRSIFSKKILLFLVSASVPLYFPLCIDDLVSFLRTCSQALPQGSGVIVVKENIAVDEDDNFDEKDSSVTR